MHMASCRTLWDALDALGLWTAGQTAKVLSHAQDSHSPLSHSNSPLHAHSPCGEVWGLKEDPTGESEVLSGLE